MESYYEIHITVSSEKLYDFTLFCNAYGYAKDYAVGPWLYPDECTSEGSNQQLMLTKMVKKTFEEAFSIAKDIGQHLTDFGIHVQRIKIETLANAKAVGEFQEKFKNSKSIGYFEFHFKVSVATKDEDQRMTNVSLKHKASFSYNAFGKTKDRVLVTLRVKTMVYDEALKRRQKLIDDLKQANLHVDSSGSGCHYEYVVFDSNPNLDDGFVPRL